MAEIKGLTEIIKSAPKREAGSLAILLVWMIGFIYITNTIVPNPNPGLHVVVFWFFVAFILAILYYDYRSSRKSSIEDVLDNLYLMEEEFSKLPLNGRKGELINIYRLLLLKVSLINEDETTINIIKKRIEELEIHRVPTFYTKTT